MREVNFDIHIAVLICIEYFNLNCSRFKYVYFPKYLTLIFASKITECLSVAIQKCRKYWLSSKDNQSNRNWYLHNFLF